MTEDNGSEEEYLKVLRDNFAFAALVGYLSDYSRHTAASESGTDVSQEFIAAVSYKMADAMLSARKKETGE